MLLRAGTYHGQVAPRGGVRSVHGTRGPAPAGETRHVADRDAVRGEVDAERSPLAEQGSYLPFEGVALRPARLEILAGDGTRAEALLDECQVLSAEIGKAPLLVEVHALRGHAALASGGDPEPSLRRARAIALEAGEGPESDSGATVVMLERAVAARDSGGALVRGYLPEDLPAGQLRWLREHHPGALVAEVRARLDDDGTLRPVTLF